MPRTAEAFRQLLGILREPQVPSVCVSRVFSIDGIRHEHWLIDAGSGEVPAYALFPEAVVPRRPAVLALHSHDRQFDVGKSEVVGLIGDPARSLGLIAAKLGFAVLAPDLPGFEEHRPPLAERKSNHALQGEAYERLLAMNALVTGTTLQGEIISDLQACMTALTSDPRVDSSRVYAAGHSFGGQEAIWATLVDSRIAGCLSSCGFSLVRLIVERNISHNLALYVPRLLPNFDFDEVAAAIAGRGLYAIAAEADAIYPVDGVRAVEDRVKRESAGTRNAIFDYIPGRHAFSVAAVSRGLEWLLNRRR